MPSQSVHFLVVRDRLGNGSEPQFLRKRADGLAAAAGPPDGGVVKETLGENSIHSRKLKSKSSTVKLLYQSDLQLQKQNWTMDMRCNIQIKICTGI